MIPSFDELAGMLGVSAEFVPFALVGVLTATVLFLQSIAQWFDDRNS
jgi:hypothetical protein